MAAGSTASDAPIELVVTRTFDAPRALVFSAWTKAEHMKRWFAPKGFTVPECTLDFRAGGKIDLCMRSPDGHDFWMRGRYSEIVSPSRIVFTSAVDGIPQEVATTVTFEEHSGKTRLTVRQVYAAETPATRGAREGWGQTLDRLAALLPELA